MPHQYVPVGFGPHHIVSAAELGSTLIVLALGLIAVTVMGFLTRTRPL